jgi:hypothetical protein
MKKTLFTISIAALVFSISAWDFILGDFGRFFFASGSEVGLNLIVSSLFLRIFLAMFLVVSLLLYNRLTRFKYCTLVILFLLAWIMSLFSVGIFPDGRVISGWSFWQFKTFNICHLSIDCEKTIYCQTKVVSHSIWSIDVINERVNERIITGPVIHEKAFEILVEAFPFRDDCD